MTQRACVCGAVDHGRHYAGCAEIQHARSLCKISHWNAYQDRDVGQCRFRDASNAGWSIVEAMLLIKQHSVIPGSGHDAH